MATRKERRKRNKAIRDRFRDPSDKRGKNPRSLANLKPPVPGEVRNPLGINGVGPYTLAMRNMSTAPMDEVWRVFQNARYTTLMQTRGVLAKEEVIEPFYPTITWAEANALERHLKAVLFGDTRDAIELREATEGRATMRVELVGKDDRLKALIESLSAARKNPPPAPSPDSAEPRPNASGS